MPIPLTPSKTLDLLHLVIPDGDGRAGENDPGQVLGHVAGPLDGDIGPDFFQRRMCGLAVGGGEGIEDDQQGNADGKPQDCGQCSSFLVVEFIHQIMQVHPFPP